MVLVCIWVEMLFIFNTIIQWRYLYPLFSNLTIQVLSYLPILSSLRYLQYIQSKMSACWCTALGWFRFLSFCLVQPSQMWYVPVLFCLSIVWYALHMSVYTVSPPHKCSTHDHFYCTAVIYIYFEQGSILSWYMNSCQAIHYMRINVASCFY